MKTQKIYISGMTCVSCQHRIEKKLKNAAGIQDAQADFAAGTASVTYDPSAIGIAEITSAIESLDYKVLDGPTAAGSRFSSMLGTAVIILALYTLFQRFGITALTSAFLLAEAGMSYGMLFVIGLMTSAHCVAMCGGINLSQCLSRSAARCSPLSAPILYNAGRVASYTLVGALAGALGSTVTLSGRFQGIVQLIAGVFMVIMGINMLGFFPFLRRFNVRMPNIFAKKIQAEKEAGRSPLIVGLLNGLMPCGPLQAMQLYALSTGSPATGAVSMFIFSAGTVPLMFGIGAAGLLLSKRFTSAVMKIGAVLVTVMGMTMFTYGFGLSGFSFGTPSGVNASMRTANVPAPVIENGVQHISSALSAGRYPAITVQQGIPVRWTITAPQGSINGCNNRMIIREYGIEYRFKPGENVIEFTPDKTGKFPYSCWMGMIRSSITVVSEAASIADIGREPDGTPQPAGVQIPIADVAVARIDRNIQEVTIKLTDNGFEPSIIVVQNSIPTQWIISNDSLDPGNSGLIVPAYYAQVPIEQGNNVIQFRPEGDFDFSTMDNIFYGYVKVVEDVTDIDIESIQTEVSKFETLIYPDEYFDEANQAGGGCCGGGA
ncbi:MAG: sulfite exporter TauE/SafE family protein [Spirochaetaceae bacterium]|jgi:sulfite exporter TauE/SafE/copper chaperone CopZ/plastocyanin domain-containing protein|nr:sulfite exporter TauE/SafE family protein [Spirochaetaceae bacterium]